MNIVAFGASTSITSINKQLANFAAAQLAERRDNAKVTLLDLNEFELPLFSVDLEAKLGEPEPARRFLQQLESADILVVSFAEHNGSYTAAWKNLFDWCSRIERKVWQGKAMLMLATSPGKGGGQNVLKAAEGSAPHFGGDVKAVCSIPQFQNAFDSEKGSFTDPALEKALLEAINKTLDALPALNPADS